MKAAKITATGTRPEPAELSEPLRDVVRRSSRTLQSSLDEVLADFSVDA
jgi:hypothetical protein